MATPAEIHGGGSSNADCSKAPGVEQRDDGYVGYVALTVNRATKAVARTVYADKVRDSYSAAMADANQLATQASGC